MKKILNNDYFLSFISKFFVIFCGFFSLIFLNRYLGVELKGEYSTIINYTSLFSTIFQFGISSIYSNYKRKKIENCFEIFLSLSIIQFALYITVAIILLPFYTHNIEVIWIVIITIISIFTTQLRYINLVENIKYNSFVVFLMSIFNCLFTVALFLLFSRNLYYALIVYIIKDITIIIFYFKKIKIRRLFLKEYKKYYIQIIKDGIFPMLSSLLIMINYKIDIIMLNFYNISFELIGLYSLGLSISEYLWVIPDIFKDVVKKRTAKDNSIETINLSLRISSTLIAIIGIVFAICGKFFLRIFFGMEYVNSYEISTILLIGVFCMSFYKIIGQLLISDGKSKHYFLILLFGAIINVIINIVLIPNYNILGAAFASVFSYAIIGLLFLIYYIKKYNTKLTELLFIKNSDLNKIRNLISHYLGGKKI